MKILRDARDSAQITPSLIGCSTIHMGVLDKLTRVGPTDVEVLLTGPSGVGKELYANYVHVHSHRQDRRFVPINCGSLSADLLENTLFGHVGGAFTGAKTQSEGLVNEAEGGTLFLDEIDSLSIACQIKLLRFLQDQKYRRLGESALRQANVRIVAATNANLEVAACEGRFRLDLFFRLRVFPVEIPALRDRPEDLPALVGAFAARASTTYGLPTPLLSHATIEHMQSYDWPGNIRELENCVSYLTCLQLGRPVEPSDLPLLTHLPETQVDKTKQSFAPGGFQETKNRVIADFERHYIERALQSSSGNVSAAARMSGKNRRALFELMRKHEISPNDFRASRS